MHWLTISDFKKFSVFRRTAFVHVIEEIQQMSQCRYHCFETLCTHTNYDIGPRSC